MSIFNVLTLFGGLAMFLYGMRIMSSGLKEGSTGTLKKIMSKITNNIVSSFLLGVVITALIQSSTATIVITSGLVAANIISVRQSLGIIVGANIGTTVTGQIIRLMDLGGNTSAWLQLFKPSSLAPIALIIGIIFIMFCKFSKSDVVGTILMGFGILFVGLMNMTQAVSALNEANVFNGLFSSLGNNPLIGYGIGALVAFILQSSSATIGILQAFSISGQLYFKSIYSVIVGIYLGDCLTTCIVCSIGAKANAKRVGVINVIYNLCETVIVLAVVTALHKLGFLDGLWNSVVNSGVIANTNTIFNSMCAIIVLPFVPFLEKLANKIVKDDEENVDKYHEEIATLDPKLYVSPALALSSCYQLLLLTFDIAKNNIKKAFSLLEEFDEKTFDEINEEEDSLDDITDKLSNYLVGINAHIKNDEHVRISSQYYNVSTEFERLGDHALNIAEYAKTLSDNDTAFSKDAIEELKVLEEIIDEILNYTLITFSKRDVEAANHIEPLEQVVDDMTAALKDNHTKRLEKGDCNVITGTIFLDLLSDIERISDVCSNVGVATVSRVMPQFASKMHNYMSLVHKDNANFNEEYEAQHNKYFNKLK